MALHITSLNSGSNGNCYYVGNATDAVLIDVGISCRETEIRMKQLGLSLKTIKAIFVSHEHTDHIKGVSTLAHKYSVPVYITDATAKNGPRLIKHLSKPFIADQPVTVGNLEITGFTKQHDAADPHSFIIRHNEITVGVFTDIGTVCKQVIRYFKQCHAVFLEANYDETLLENGGYPIYLKNRIRGGQGHLSNKEALELFIEHRPSFMTHLLLSHLSKDNNSPQLAEELFKKHAGDTNIIVASRYQATDVITITGNEKAEHIISSKPMQLGLFS
ncbi:MBL fold metallo-hydrolase [Ferruginibacter lapsinanis]|uniref:MBL fold metallo-hydrolase n=1 Tax=Ferruginibacter lapsinanis TaxID=563172 RepID=UPI001E4840CC|nr:MBL fold metallo-hydrolase [Ferruginibacter lapsinanis]UEG50719.1 MBL fold metallo-hydrolase [Ferruginibacter lapsinanis]